MTDRLARMQQQILAILQQEIQGWMNDLMKGMLDPAKIMQFAKMMGIDLNAMPGMMSQQPGFDPYQVLGLDKSASDDEVKQAYRKIMFQVHPDKAGPELKFMAAIANAAYKMIERQRGWQQ